ncbi:MAG: M48 family metallopeptidase [Gammaproteobacteria bacterium]|nr:M48 family metallopeptidase [Gammaproteobacteria bacterium]
MDESRLFRLSGAESIEIKLRISSRVRYVRLRILPSAEVEVVVPHGFDQRQLPAILEKQRDWLVRTLDVAAARQKVARVRPELIELPAVNEQWPVRYRDNPGARRCRLTHGELCVTAGEHDWLLPLQRWLARKAREHLVPLLDTLSCELQLPYGKVSIRGQKTRWGSCSSRKSISLNYRLLFLPPEMVRYLLVHELCHTVHMNHSPRYWQLVAEKMPDYAHYDRSLRKAGERVPAWARAY